MENLTSFTGATLGNTGCCEPPDTQVAVSSSDVFEPVNLTAFLFNHGGTNLGSFDLVSFFAFGQANNFGSDPKVVYDAGSDRWYMTLMVCQNAGCGGNWSTMGVDVAVSQTNDPLGSWLIYQNIYSGTPFNDQGNLQDQPKLGFSADKVTISDNVYSGHCGAGSCFLHEDVITWNKSELFTGSAHYVGWTSGYAFDTIPASPSTSSANSSNTQFLAWQGFGSLGVGQITGLPNVSAVSLNTQSPAIGNMTGTVNAAGVPAGAQSGNFVESATWNSNHLWAASTDGCTRGGGTVDCTRIDEVDTSNPGSVSILLDQDIGDAGAYEIYPSVAQDCLGDLWFGITYSDGSTLPSAAMIGSTTPGAASYVRVDYAVGDTTYSGGRWGDYSGIQEDPSDCGNVWTAQEFGGLSSSGNWATGIGQFSFDTPFLSSVSPSSGPATGGTTVDIFGFDFVNGGTSVSFGGTPAASVTFIDAHHIQAVSPAGSGGPVDITAATLNGTTPTTGGDHWSWIPVVTKLSPNAGPTSGNNEVDIFGVGFTGATAVHFGSHAATSMVVNSDGKITTFAPPAATGTVDVTVTGPTGTSAAVSADVYAYGPPTVTGVIPAAGPKTGGNLVVIKGARFVPRATVLFGSTPSPSVTFVSTTQLKAVAPAAGTGLVNVRVSTPAGTSATSPADEYTFDPKPSVSGLSPDVGPTSGGNLVVITGSGFTRGATVKFGSTASATVTFVSSVQLKAVAPSHAAGTVDVTVATPGGTSAGSVADLYAYGAPTVGSFTPSSGITGSTVSVTGKGFSLGAVVRFGALASPTVTVVSGTSLKAVVPNGAVPGKISVSDSQGADTSASSFTPTFSITSFSPASGPSGTVVTIHGVGFNSGSKVKFNGASASAVTFVSAAQLKATVPAGATTGPITVTNSSGVIGAVRSASNFTKT